MAESSLEMAPAQRPLADIRLTLALNRSAHALNENLIQIVDNSTCRARGGFGEVARAILHAVENCVHPGDSDVSSSTNDFCQDVAVKILLISEDVSADIMEKRFAREVYVWSQLRHENILEMLGHYFRKDERRFCLVCPWVCGGNAVAYLRAHNPEHIEKLRFSTDAAKGLVYLHTREPPICHGDIKAANVLINDGRAQLCDFGLASVVQDEGTSSLATGSDFKGSIRWCSPELLDGAKRSPQSDVWAWGWLVWEIMTGTLPFHGTNFQGAIVKRIVFFKLPDLTSLPMACQPLMQGCWKPDGERLMLVDAIVVLKQAIDDALQVQTQLASNFPVATPNLQLAANSPPQVPAAMISLPILLENKENQVGPGPLIASRPPELLRPPSRHPGTNAWRAISNFIGCCLCVSCGSDSELGEKYRNPDVPMASLPSRRHEDRTTNSSRTPSAIENATLTSDGRHGSFAAASSENGGSGFPVMRNDVREIESENTIPPSSDLGSESLSLHDLVDVVPVPGCSSLFRGKWKASGKIIAIKAPRDLNRALELIRHQAAEEVQKELEMVIAFRLQIKKSKSLVNRCINPIDGHIAIDGHLAIVSPWRENGNIREFVKRNPGADIWDLLDGIFDGLMFLHGQHPPVVHGCLKPENILIDAEGRVLLSEVGELPFLENFVDGVTTCGQGQDIRWSPPEVLEGAKWSTLTDVYTVGLLAQSIISGMQPFANFEAPADVVRQVNFGNRPFNISSQTFPAWESVWDLLNRCTHSESTQRPTIFDVKSQFRGCRAASSLPTFSSPTHAVEPMFKWGVEATALLEDVQLASTVSNTRRPSTQMPSGDGTTSVCPEQAASTVPAADRPIIHHILTKPKDDPASPSPQHKSFTHMTRTSLGETIRTSTRSKGNIRVTDAAMVTDEAGFAASLGLASSTSRLSKEKNRLKIKERVREKESAPRPSTDTPESQMTVERGGGAIRRLSTRNALGFKKHLDTSQEASLTTSSRTSGGGWPSSMAPSQSTGSIPSPALHLSSDPSSQKGPDSHVLSSTSIRALTSPPRARRPTVSFRHHASSGSTQTSSSIRTSRPAPSPPTLLLASSPKDPNTSKKRITPSPFAPTLPPYPTEQATFPARGIIPRSNDRQDPSLLARSSALVEHTAPRGEGSPMSESGSGLPRPAPSFTSNPLPAAPSVQTSSRDQTNPVNHRYSNASKMLDNGSWERPRYQFEVQTPIGTRQGSGGLAVWGQRHGSTGAGIIPPSEFDSMHDMNGSAIASSSKLIRGSSTASAIGGGTRPTIIVAEPGKAPMHYQLGNCIGKGQFGAVYRALNLNTGQMVAVKRISLEGLPESEVMQLMKEVDLLKTLKHPSIVGYEGMSRDDDALDIVLEYVENGSLGQTLKAFGKFNEKLVATYVTKIIEGLHYLHEQKVVHCDLKAANILSTKNGNVKLCDFGVSLSLNAMETAMETHKEYLGGAPNWMAPEVIELKGVSPASDIWSLGCTVVELLTGKPPYSEISNPLAVMFRIVEDPNPPIPEGCSEPLRDFLSLCFKKDPAHRPTPEELFEHPWLKRTWGLNKELRPGDSVPFLRRVSTDLQARQMSIQNLAEMSQAQDQATPVVRTPSDEPEFVVKPHSFVKTTFSKAVTCKVCHQSVKKSAVLCEECSLICHSSCAKDAPSHCDVRAQLLLYSQYSYREDANPQPAAQRVDRRFASPQTALPRSSLKPFSEVFSSPFLTSHTSSPESISSSAQTHSTNNLVDDRSSNMINRLGQRRIVDTMSTDASSVLPDGSGANWARRKELLTVGLPDSPDMVTAGIPNSPRKIHEPSADSDLGWGGGMRSSKHIRRSSLVGRDQMEETPSVAHDYS